MTIVEADITDQVFTKLSSAQKTAYLATGNLHFDMLCAKSGIVSASIPASRPYTPLRIGIICVLIAVVTDMIGNDWKEIAQGGVYDPNKTRLDALNVELNDLLGSFTPAMCGYTDDTAGDATSSISSQFHRA